GKTQHNVDDQRYEAVELTHDRTMVQVPDAKHCENESNAHVQEGKYRCGDNATHKAHPAAFSKEEPVEQPFADENDEQNSYLQELLASAGRDSAAIQFVLLLKVREISVGYSQLVAKG